MVKTMGFESGLNARGVRWITHSVAPNTLVGTACENTSRSKENQPVNAVALILALYLFAYSSTIYSSLLFIDIRTYRPSLNLIFGIQLAVSFLIVYITLIVIKSKPTVFKILLCLCVALFPSIFSKAVPNWNERIAAMILVADDGKCVEQRPAICIVAAVYRAPIVDVYTITSVVRLDSKNYDNNMIIDYLNSSGGLVFDGKAYNPPYIEYRYHLYGTYELLIMSNAGE